MSPQPSIFDRNERLTVDTSVSWVDVLDAFHPDQEVTSSVQFIDDVNAAIDERLLMTAETNYVDEFITIVDLYGRTPPAARFMLLESGVGYVTLEDGVNKLRIV
jgi:hypothetical protein